MRNTKNTAKVRKTNRKIAASVCAVIAATAMVTGIAVFTASAKTIECKTSSLSSLISSTATVQQSADTNTTKDNNNTKQDAPAAQKQTAPEAQQQAVPEAQQQVVPEAQQQAVPEVQKQAVPEAQQQAVPEVQQQAIPEAQQQAAPTVQQTAPAASQDNSQNKPLTIPDGEVNDWRTHDAKDGFPIGEFLDRSQSKHLFVTKLDDWRYSITVKVVTGEKTATVYNINAFANGNKMEYTDGTKCEVVYGDDLNIVHNNVLSSNHKGTFDASDAGYTWVDSTDGTTIFVPWVGYPYAK